MTQRLRPSPTLLRLLAAVPVLISSAQAYAADEPVQPAKQPIQKVEIKGAAETYDARRNDTATKIVVTQEEILKNGDTTIGEVLKRLPGITVGGVQGRGGDIRMRGLGSGYTQIMLNGEPAPPGFSLDSLSPDMIERIEVMRAATAEFSTQAIAGGINIVLKKAIVTAQREVKVGLQDDNGKLGTNTNFQLSDRKGAISYAVGGGVTYGKFNRPAEIVTTGYTPAGEQHLLRRTEQTSQGTFQALNLSPRVNVNLGPNDIVTSQSFVNVNRFRGDTDERVNTLQGKLPRYSATSVNIDSDVALLRTDLTWTRKLAAGAKLEVKGGANYNKRSTEAPTLQYFANNVLAVDRLVTSDSTDKGFTTTGKYSTPLFEGHALATGWDAGYSKRDEDRIQRESSPIGAPVSDLDQVYNAEVQRLALYAQDEWTITDRWSVYFGLRWEGIETTSEGNDYAPVSNKSSVWSPLFQTLWKIPGSKADQVRLGISRTYKAPGVNSLIPRRFAANNNTATSPDQTGNPLLKPELAWGLDLAFEHYLPGGGLMTASTFVRRIKDITRQQVALVDGLYVSRPMNAGTANTRGIELEAKLPLRSMYPTAPAIEMRANLSRNWSDLDSVPGPNNRLDQQTPVSGTVGADWKLDSLPLTLGGSFSFQSGGPVRISEKQYAYSIPKRSLDLYGLWKFTPKTQLRVAVANALHQDNYSESTFVEPTGTLRDGTLTPTTAVVRALLEMKF
ncbi:TonB-dependent siderophore receptor [Massilia sp. Root351]|uniref:TonB-dependent receptor plug domain-containing protein n=1 Tax=Massilia sp. Root351 TaxID=1736522 RepID=UPI000A9688C0|nr:TonB-dependent receptor [Massilia sp. Root351]